MQQIPVGGVKLDHVEADANCAFGCLAEGVADAVETMGVERHGGMIVVGERNGRGSRSNPGVFAILERAATFPGPLRRCLAAGVGELDAPFCVGRCNAAGRVQRAGQSALVQVAVEAKATVRDAAVAFHSSGFKDNESHA